MKHLTAILLTLGLIVTAAAVPVPARAATIFWALNDIDGSTGLGDAAVRTNGTLIEGANFGGTGVPNVTVNTVPFSGVDFTSGSPTNLAGLTYDNGWSGYGTSTGGSIDTLTDTFAAKSGVDPQNGTLTGLQVGRQYEVQFFLSHTTVSRTLDITSGNMVRIGTRNPAQFATGFFAADGTTQAISFDASEGSQFLSAYQLREVPALAPPTITNMTVNGSSRTYTLAPGVMTNGSVAYTDRTYNWENVPAYLEGADYVLTPANDRDNSALSIDLAFGQAGTLYAWFDNRPGAPSWANGWTDTGHDIYLGPNRTEAFSLFEKPLAAGTHTGVLGPADAPGQGMYGFSAVELPPGIRNPGFEDPGGTVSAPRPQASDWSGSAPSVLHSAFPYGNNGALGTTFVYTSPALGDTWQTIGTSFAPETAYVFKGYGVDNDINNENDLEFMLGYRDSSGVFQQLASQVYDLTGLTSWTELDGVSYTTGASGPELGQLITVRLGAVNVDNVNGGVFFDQVSLSSTSLTIIPEPATLLIWSLLAGLGIGVGLWWRRR